MAIKMCNELIESITKLISEYEINSNDVVDCKITCGLGDSSSYVTYVWDGINFKPSKLLPISRTEHSE